MKLKGLVFKEIYLGRKKYLVMTAIWLMLAVLGILIRLSIMYGNMSGMSPEELADTEPVMYYIFSYLPAFILMYSTVGSTDDIYSDNSSGWTIFSITAPISEGRYIGIKYLVKTAMIILAFGLSLCNSAILCALNDKSFNKQAVTILFFIMLLVLAVTVISRYTAYKYNSKSKAEAIQLLYGVGAYLVVMGGAWLWYKSFKKTHSYLSQGEFSNKLRQTLFGLYSDFKNVFFSSTQIVILLMLFTLIAGYSLEVRMLKRRKF